MSLVSIVIPTYNRLDYLKIALDSCLKQTVLPNKIIIGDDSTNDETEEWIKAFNPEQSVEIEYIRNRPSLKQAANVEMLMQRVETTYLLLLHDDDLLLQNALEDLLSVVKEHTDVDVAFGKQYIIDAAGIVNEHASENLNRSFFRTQDEVGVIKKSISVILRQQLPSNSFLVKTDLAKKLHYGEKEKAGNGVDFHFCYKLGLADAVFYYTDIFVSCYRDSPDGISKMSDSGYYAYKLISEIPTVADVELETLKDSSLRRLAPIAIMQAINHNKKEEGKKIFFSEHHRSRILSLGGVRRGIKLFL